MKFYISIAFLFYLLSFSSITMATPFLHDPAPANNTFIAGGSKLFSVNVTSSNLNSNTVALHVVSQDAHQRGEDWDIHLLTCVSASGEWNCTKTLSFAIAGSDTVEYFYFRGNDTDGTTATSGTSSNYFVLSLDRNPPSLSFVKPVNSTYISGVQKISFSVVDPTSGVDNNTVQYSLDNSLWTVLKNTSITTFEENLNTTTFADNQTITIYGKASDKVGNGVSNKISVTIENEMPKLAILSPSTLLYAGYTQLKVNVNDTYSGIDFSKVRYSIEGFGGTLGCIGDKYNSTCSAVFDTSQLTNGNHTVSFSVTDKAGNSKDNSVVIQTDNTKPTISITSPSQNSYLRGNVTVNAALTNAKNTVQYVTITLQKTGLSSTQNMTCDANITSCQYTLDTASFADDQYTLKAAAVNQLNFDVNHPISVTLDNKAPSVSIFFPSTLNVAGIFKIEYSVNDEIAVDKDTATFKIGDYSQSISCSLQLPGRSMICSTNFDSKTLSDGSYTLQLFGKDLAGNTGSASTPIKINNSQSGVSGGPSGTSSSGSGTNGTTGGGSGQAGSSGGQDKNPGGLLAWLKSLITDGPLAWLGSIIFNGPLAWLKSLNIDFNDTMLIGAVIVFVAIVVSVLFVIIRNGLRKNIITN